MKHKPKPLKLYILGAIISYPLIAGWVNASFKAEFPDESHRQHLGFSLGWGIPASLCWPIFLPGVYLMTGFAEDGWSLTTK